MPLRSPSKAVGQTKTGWLDILFSRVRDRAKFTLPVLSPSRPHLDPAEEGRWKRWPAGYLYPHEGRPRLRLPVMFPGWKQGLGRREWLCAGVSQNGNKGLVLVGYQTEVKGHQLMCGPIPLYTMLLFRRFLLFPPRVGTVCLVLIRDTKRGTPIWG